jgi:hypothetical protein
MIASTSACTFSRHRNAAESQGHGGGNVFENAGLYTELLLISYSSKIGSLPLVFSMSTFSMMGY